MAIQFLLLVSEWLKIRTWHSSDSRFDPAWSWIDSIRLKRRTCISLPGKRLHFFSYNVKRKHVAPSICWVSSYDPERSHPVLLATWNNTFLDYLGQYDLVFWFFHWEVVITLSILWDYFIFVNSYCTFIFGVARTLLRIYSLYYQYVSNFSLIYSCLMYRRL